MRLAIDATQLVGMRELWARAPELMREEMLPAVVESDLLLQGELQRDLPTGAGGAAGLKGSIFTEEQSLAGNVIGTVASPMPYALYVEIGTGPRQLMPPFQPIYDWVRAKLGLDDAEAMSATFLIRRKIQREGTPAQPIWARTLEAKQMDVLVKLTLAMNRVLTRLAA